MVETLLCIKKKLCELGKNAEDSFDYGAMVENIRFLGTIEKEMKEHREELKKHFVLLYNDLRTDYLNES